MKIIKTDFDYQSADGSLQYKRVQGTLEQQQKAFTDGGFAWVSASNLRKLILDNPEENFGNNWHRVGNGSEYMHTDAIKLRITPQSRILVSGQDVFNKAVDQIRKTENYDINSDEVKALEQAATKTNSGIYVIDLDKIAKNKDFEKDNKTFGHATISTTDYKKQMQDDPELAKLVNASYGLDEILDRTMQDLKAKEKDETWLFTLMPEHVRATAREGTGLGCLSAVVDYNGDGGGFSAGHLSIDGSGAFAFGVRQAAAGGNAEKSSKKELI